MPYKNKRKKKMEEGKNVSSMIADEAKKVHDKLKKHINKESKICTSLFVIHEMYIEKSHEYDTFTPYAPQLDAQSWEKSETTVKAEIDLLEDLQLLNGEITGDSEKINEWGATAVSGQIMAESGVVTIYNTFQDVAPAKIIEAVGEQIEDTTSENIKQIGQLLELLFSRQVSQNFKQIIDNWNSATHDKHAVLNDLRNFIFDELITDIDPIGKEYKHAWWFTHYNEMNYKKQFTKVRFFILGYKNVLLLQKSTLHEIDSVANSLKDDFQLLSKFGHERKGSDKNMEITYKDTISHLLRMLILRQNHHY